MDPADAAERQHGPLGAPGHRAEPCGQLGGQVQQAAVGTKLDQQGGG
ncbi:hypothetical protein ACH4E7_24410 [Kitasatospora sp. NPDC018058]